MGVGLIQRLDGVSTAGFFISTLRVLWVLRFVGADSTGDEILRRQVPWMEVVFCMSLLKAVVMQAYSVENSRDRVTTALSIVINWISEWLGF